MGLTKSIKSILCFFQVRRLQSHASIALWAGNNENEVALVGNWYNTDANFTLYKEDYIKLYANTIMDVVTNEDKRRPFIVSKFKFL
jgi:beta-mannosidase